MFNSDSSSITNSQISYSYSTNQLSFSFQNLQNSSQKSNMSQLNQNEQRILNFQSNNNSYNIEQKSFYQPLKQILVELDQQFSKDIQYFKPNILKLKINTQQTYQLYYASSTTTNKFGLIIKFFEEDLIYVSQKIQEKPTNQELDFIAVIHGIRYCLELGIEKLQVLGNNQLVTNYLTYVQASHLLHYKEVIEEYRKFFIEISFQQVSKDKNFQAKHLSRVFNDILEVAIQEKKEKEIDEKNKFDDGKKIKQQLEIITKQFQNIFSNYKRFEEKQLSFDTNKFYALIFYQCLGQQNQQIAFCFEVYEDVNQIYQANFFEKQSLSSIDMALAYGLMFLLENQIRKVICFSEQKYVIDNIQNLEIKDCIKQLEQYFDKILFKQKILDEMRKKSNLIQTYKTGQQIFFYSQKNIDDRKIATLSSFKQL